MKELQFKDGCSSANYEHQIYTTADIQNVVLSLYDYNQRVVDNVTSLAKSGLPGTYIDPVSGKKLFNEAALDYKLTRLSDLQPAGQDATPEQAKAQITIPEPLAAIFPNLNSTQIHKLRTYIKEEL